MNVSPLGLAQIEREQDAPRWHQAYPFRLHPRIVGLSVHVRWQRAPSRPGQPWHEFRLLGFRREAGFSLDPGDLAGAGTLVCDELGPEGDLRDGPLEPGHTYYYTFRGARPNPHRATGRRLRDGFRKLFVDTRSELLLTEPIRFTEALPRGVLRIELEGAADLLARARLRTQLRDELRRAFDSDLPREAKVLALREAVRDAGRVRALRDAIRSELVEAEREKQRWHDLLTEMGLSPADRAQLLERLEDLFTLY